MHAVTRAALPALLAGRRPAGHVIDCIGLTGDFRVRPLDTAEAHVGLVARCLAELQFDSFLLLSSTRVYARAERDARGRGAAGDARRSLRPLQPDEARRRGAVSRRSAPTASAWCGCRTSTAPACRRRHSSDRCCAKAARPAAWCSARAPHPPRTMSASPRWCGCCRRSPRPAGSGSTTSRPAATPATPPSPYCLRDIAGWHTSFAPDAPTVRQPPIDTARLDAEFGPTASNLVADLPALLALAQEDQCSPSTRPMAA